MARKKNTGLISDGPIFEITSALFSFFKSMQKLEEDGFWGGAR